MPYPAGVATRTVTFGGAATVEAGRTLTIRTTTTASRSLIWNSTGYRLESITAQSESSTPGTELSFTVPVTTQSGWLDAETRQTIDVSGEDTHSHLYTTILSIYDGTVKIRDYTIGPYPVPAGSGVLDGDTMLIPNVPATGTLVALPESWLDLIEQVEELLEGGVTGGVVTVNTRNGDVVLTKADVGLANVDNTSDANKAFTAAQTTSGTFADARIPALAISKITNLQATLDAKVATTARGAANGVASLGSDSKIPAAQLPDISVTDFLGSPANQTAMLALVGQKGDWAIRTDLGTTWVITGSDPTQLGSWTQMAYPTAPVSTVAGRTGAVTLVAGDILSGTFDPARLPAATETAIGAAERGTQAEVNTGTDPTRYVSPATLQGKLNGMNLLRSANGTFTGMEYYATEASLPDPGVSGVLYFTDAEV